MAGMYEFDPEWVAKVEALRAEGVDPYPSGLRVSGPVSGYLESFEDLTEEPDWRRESERLGVISLGGRVVAKRDMGKALFLKVQDFDHAIQVYVRRDDVGEPSFGTTKGLDMGDIVWAAGTMMRTRTGELTLAAQEVRLAGKCATPFPDRYHGVSDVEFRSRNRHIDLFLNAETRDTFRKRSFIVRGIRDYLEDDDYIEVETPMMHPIPGGAAAKPFVTHHNALDMDLYLRVAPELYLKRLIVGGMTRVYEVNRCFRNEGVSVKHNPEFTSVEFYQAWATASDLMTLIEGMLSYLTGGTLLSFNGMEINLNGTYRRADMDVLIAEATGLTLEELGDVARMETFWRERHPGEGRKVPEHRGGWWEWLFEEYVEKTLIQPTFVTGFPVEISPLARRSDTRPDRCDRFELIIAGWEFANGFSELNDPVDQASRFEAQAAAHAAGNPEAMHFDADYVRALTYGMPPTAGAGIGVDRLVMLLTGRTSIREVVLFPAMRPTVS